MEIGNDELLRDYRALLEKVSAKFNEIHDRHRAKMVCGRGCSACCAPNLTVFAAERANIRSFLSKHPEVLAKAMASETEDFHGGQRCKFLDQAGECTIYEVRPIVCRSHGAPIFSKAEGQAILDVCPENFADVHDLSTLSGQDFVNIDLLNQMLAIVNSRFVAARDPGGTAAGALARYELAPSKMFMNEEQ
jgi:Fe-S-cluster containining protein